MRSSSPRVVSRRYSPRSLPVGDELTTGPLRGSARGDVRISRVRPLAGYPPRGRTPAEAARIVVRPTAVLAMPAPQQEAWLSSISVEAPVDELALEFNDGHLLLSQVGRGGLAPG